MNKKLRYGFALTALLLLAPAFPRAARATDIISNFNIQGTAENTSGNLLGTCASDATCSFSGTMAVDITAGSVSQFDVTFPGLQPFSTISTQTSTQTISQVVSSSDGADLQFDFTVSPTPGTLVGFTGGTISPYSALNLGGIFVYSYLRGTISAASTVPEPGSLALLAAGLLGLGWALWRRKLRTDA